MAGETIITVVGNLTADPELRYTQNGLPVANFTIASTPRTLDRATNEWKDGEALFLRASVWREFAEHVAGSLTKGSRVVATGRLKQRSYETKEGEKRTSIELEIDEIGPSLRYATAQVTRAAGGGGQSRGQVSDEPWSTPGSRTAIMILMTSSSRGVEARSGGVRSQVASSSAPSAVIRKPFCGPGSASSSDSASPSRSRRCSVVYTCPTLSGHTSPVCASNSSRN
jgi:single-strand DNA-binding protein